MLKALIFDFDGLILDTETPEYTALTEAYAEYGQKISVETYGLVVGVQYNQVYEPVSHLQELTGRSLDAASFWEKVNRRRLELIDQNPLLPGVEDLIHAARSRGLRLAVASSSAHAWVDGHLKHHHIYDCFDVIICKDDVLNIKPEPDLFLAALAGLNVAADEAFIFEDSLNGVIAAGRAGIRVIMIPNPVTEHMQVAADTPRLRSMTEISLDDLMSKL